jgi:hypothetical protein
MPTTLISYLPSMYHSFSGRRPPWPRWTSVPAPADRDRHAGPVVDQQRLGPPQGAGAAPGDLVRRRHRDPHLAARPGLLPLAPLGTLLGDGVGAVLDGASLLASTVDRPRSPDADSCTRAAYVALRRIATSSTSGTTPTRTGRADHGPYAPWSSDRSMIERNGPRNRRCSRSGT